MIFRQVIVFLSPWSQECQDDLNFMLDRGEFLPGIRPNFWPTTLILKNASERNHNLYLTLCKMAKREKSGIDCKVLTKLSMFLDRTK